MAYVLIVFITYLTQIGANTGEVEQAEECPLWTLYRNNTGSCVCADEVGLVVKCNPENKSLSIRICYCMTADSGMNPVVGACLYNCRTDLLDDLKYLNIYKSISTNVTSGINAETCAAFNRKGLMCGQCIDTYGLPVYSYIISCVKCSHKTLNWLKYIAVAYLPLTAFYLIIVIFRISANSGLLIGYVTISQMVATYSLVQLYLALNSQADIMYTHLIKVISIFYSVWNLDFFRTIFPSFCLHPDLSPLQVISLDYLVAVYPMLAVLITYFVVQKSSYVTCWCESLHKCLHLFKKEWKIGNSLIESLATLLLLSYVKILNISFNILTPTYIYHMNGTHNGPNVYNDPRTVYLSKEHQPYFVMAITMSFVFNFLPFLLLCVYPCKCFQKCLSCTGLHHQALTTFMDAFQGCYKHKPFYLRSFPALYLLAQFTNMLILSYFGIEQYHSAASLNLMAVVTLIAITRPYKRKWHNVISLTLFGAMFISYISVVLQLNASLAVHVSGSWKCFLRGLSYGGGLVSPTYGFLILFWGVLPARVKKMIMGAKILKDTKKNKTIQSPALPYRFESDHENTPLLGY